MVTESPLIVVLDYSSLAECMALVDQLDPSQCRVKVGKELFVSAGPQVVEILQQRGFDVFLDLKFHDIPNTVAQAVNAAADLGVWMVNVHASGGRRMMTAAREILAKRSGPVPLLIGVTVLTSLSDKELQEVGLERSAEAQVNALAALAQDCGLDGVVCSAWEAQSLQVQRGKDFCLVTPGIRPAGSDHNDQRRVMTPAEALTAGSHYLVIGRPITQAADPAAACSDILQSLNQ